MEIDYHHYVVCKDRVALGNDSIANRHYTWIKRERGNLMSHSKSDVCINELVCLIVYVSCVDTI